ncbi:hypothetical protein D3C76_1068250 [compost metagenome]
MALVGRDDIQRGLGIGLVALHVVGQAHGEEAIGVIAGFRAQAFHRALAEHAGSERVDAAADAQHQGLHAGIAQAILDEVEAPLDFRLDVFRPVERRLDVQLGDDGVLDGFHDVVLVNTQAGSL